MSYPKITTAADLRPGDKVCGHENGWLTVYEVRKEWPGHYRVLFRCPLLFGKLIEKTYRRDEPVEFIREE